MNHLEKHTNQFHIVMRQFGCFYFFLCVLRIGNKVVLLFRKSISFFQEILTIPFEFRIRWKDLPFSTIQFQKNNFTTKNILSLSTINCKYFFQFSVKIRFVLCGAALRCAVLCFVPFVLCHVRMIFLNAKCFVSRIRIHTFGVKWIVTPKTNFPIAQCLKLDAGGKRLCGTNSEPKINCSCAALSLSLYLFLFTFSFKLL